MLKHLLLSFLLFSPYCLAQQGGGPGGGGSGGATTPATSAVLKGNGSTNGVVAATPGVDFLAPGALPNATTATTQTTGDTSTKVATDAFVLANAGGAANIPATPMVLKGSGTLGSATAATLGTDFTSNGTVTPQQFGGYGDAYLPPNGCSTTASSITVTCPDGPFISTAKDSGKQIWVSGAGTSGVAFHATISTVTSSTAVVVNSAAPLTVSGARAVYGHDDVTAINSCIQYSASNAANCVIRTATTLGSGLVGFLVGSGQLLLTSNNALEENSGPNIVGNSQSEGSNFFCELNDFCMALAAGPVQGANVRDVSFEEDQTQPNSAGIHLNPQNGTFGPGPFTNSNFIHVNVDNPAKQCLWMDGGGGPSYNYFLPNQYVTFDQFWCSGPNQSHPSNLMLLTGQAAQIIFINGQVNGQTWNGSSVPNYPNPLISITEKTSGLGDSPVDVKFFGFTAEVGTQGLYVGNGTSNIHYDNGYIENTATPFIVTGSLADTFNGNHIANSGNTTGVFQFAAGSGASVRDTLVYGGVTPAAFAVCSNNNNELDFVNNNSTVTTTSGCVTPVVTTASSSLTVTGGTTASVTATGGAIQTIGAAGVAPGKTLTLYAPSGLQLASGGNIAFGGVSSPLTVASGGTVVLTLLDSGVTWAITSGAAVGGGSPTPSWSTVVHSANTDTGAFSSAGAWTYSGDINYGHNVYANSNSGGTSWQMGPGATCSSNCTSVYDDGNFHINGTTNGNHGLFFQGNFANLYIAAFAPNSGTNVFTVGIDGTLNTSGGVNYPTYTVATLPGVPGAGKAIVVTDSTNTTLGSCSGGGTNTVLAISNGTNWVCQAPGTIPICNGQITLGTTLITSGNAATTIATTCTGLQSTDNIQLDYASSPIGVTGYTNSASGMLSIIKWPATNTLNVSIFNNTSSSITPGAMTLNYHVTR